MAFTFEIKDVLEIVKDPLGHHHHWTLLYGKLVDGTINLRDRIEIPFDDDLPLVAGIFGFNAFPLLAGKRIEVDSIRAEEIDEEFGVMTRCLAGSQQRILKTHATDCSDERYRYLLREILLNDPARILHQHSYEWVNAEGQKKTGFSGCPVCDKVLRTIEGTRAILQQLTEHSDAYIVKRAVYLLKSL